MAKILTKIKDKYVALKGFHTDRHIIVIESDDWGSIRMPSKEILNKLINLGDKTNNDAFLNNDCLESDADLISLFDMLLSIKDSNGNFPVITANFAVANPNFEKMKKNNNNYFWEPFYETYDKYYPNNKVLEKIREGIKKNIFCPQLHCREHLNVNRWMRDIYNKKSDTMIAYENNMIGINASFTKNNIFGYMDSFNEDCSSIFDLEKIFIDSYNIFYDTFGYKSKSFVASCFVWSDEFEKVLFKNGIKGIQTSCWQNVPKSNKKFKLGRRLHYTGEKNKYNQYYTVRNCSYEPAYSHNPEQAANNCLIEIKKSFANRKPAIINSHRFNYISSINKDNAYNNIKYLGWLLAKVIDEYNDVEFFTTPQLLDLIGEASEK